MNEMSYLRLRAIVLREAMEMVRHCGLAPDEHPTVKEDDLHEAIDKGVDRLRMAADSSEEAADKLEELAVRPTPGFWPQMPPPPSMRGLPPIPEPTSTTFGDRGPTGDKGPDGIVLGYGPVPGTGPNDE